jgi:hypothetical protein
VEGRGVYPYQEEPPSATEKVEREIFDIVAVVQSGHRPGLRLVAPPR